MALKLSRALTLIPLLIVSVGCETASTQILLTVAVGPDLQSQAARVQVETLEPDGSPHALETFPLTGSGPVEFSLGIVPRGGDATTPALVWVGLFDASGAILRQQEQVVAFESGRTVHVRVEFGSVPTDGGLPDASTDAGQDALDASGPDGGPEDAVTDPDAPAMCPPSLVRCGGGCVDINLNATHCGGRDQPCDGECVMATCESGDCIGNEDCAGGELCCPARNGSTSCAVGVGCPEVTDEQCSDGVDNDMNKTFDCGDPSCRDSAPCA